MEQTETKLMRPWPLLDSLWETAGIRLLLEKLDSDAAYIQINPDTFESGDQLAWTKTREALQLNHESPQQRIRIGSREFAITLAEIAPESEDMVYPDTLVGVTQKLQARIKIQRI